MTWVPLAIAACMSHWMTPVPALSVDCMAQSWAQSDPIRLILPPLAPNRLLQQAQAITVQIKSVEPNGSGVLIRRQGAQYTVLTNRHVVNRTVPYVIQTLDGQTHPATLVKKVDFHGNDLALLQFQSQNHYAIARLGSVKPLRSGDLLLSAGFPLEPPPTAIAGLLISVGKVSLLPRQAFAGGYQIGYTNLILQGMSGGPVLNVHGEVVGINSLHAYPLWGDPYVFQDGSKPSQHQHQQISRLSWAVPIDTFLHLPLF